MISHPKEETVRLRHILLKFLLATAVLLSFLSTPLMAADNPSTNNSFSGELDTTFRMQTNTDGKRLFPVFEYTHLDFTDNLSDGAVASFYLGAWGRVDLADKSGNKYSEGDLQYAYLSYRAAKNNWIANFGRQFINEGVATERVDGLYLRSDFAGGVGTAVFGGVPVITEPSYNGGNVVYGTRISQTDRKYYTVGLSFLKSERDGSATYREEEGMDLWLHPMEQADLSGRSTYNSLTGGWMEHNYVLSILPLEKFRLSADFTRINYYDYFYNMTTSALSITNRLDPNEKLTAGGISLSYSPNNNLTFSTDYKLYGYEIAKNADYYGGKVTYNVPQSYAVGLGIHRMDGKIDRHRYTEFRAYASKIIGRANVALDITNLGYDAAINGVKNSVAVTGSTGYELNDKLRLGASMEYLQNPDFDNEIRALLKVTYAFNTKHVEAGGRHEK